MPEKWFSQEYELRRQKCGLAASTTLKTIPQLATEMLNHFVEEAAVSFKYVVADSVYGNSAEFIEAVEFHAHLTYFVETPYDTGAGSSGLLRETRNINMELRSVQKRFSKKSPSMSTH